MDNHRMSHAVLVMVLMLMTWAMFVATRAQAQEPEDWVLFGHDNPSSSTVTIDTRNGLARRIGPTGFDSGASGLASCRAPVPVQGPYVYPVDTNFGLLRDQTFNKDYLVAIENETGEAIRTVELDFTVGGRGVAFGPDGKTFYGFIPPGELYTIGTTDGFITKVGDTIDVQGRQFSGVSLQWDPLSEQFLAVTQGTPTSVVLIDPATAAATLIGTIEDMNVCTITRAPGPVEGPGGKVYPEGTWFTINNNTNRLHALSIDTIGARIVYDEEIGALGPSASQVCGTAFSLPETPFVTPTHPGYPPYPGPTDTSTPPGSGIATHTPTPWSFQSTPTFTPPVPAASPTTGVVADCVCPIVSERVPVAVISHALANPHRYYGWQIPLDPGKPESPANPPRDCLNLPYVKLPFHPVWNLPVWKVGCH